VAWIGYVTFRVMGGKSGKKRQQCGNGWQGGRQKRQGWEGGADTSKPWGPRVPVAAGGVFGAVCGSL